MDHSYMFSGSDPTYRDEVLQVRKTVPRRAPGPGWNMTMTAVIALTWIAFAAAEPALGASNVTHLAAVQRQAEPRSPDDTIWSDAEALMRAGGEEPGVVLSSAGDAVSRWRERPFDGDLIWPPDET